MNVTYCRFARVKRTNVPPGRFKGRGRQSHSDVTIATPKKSRLPSSHTHRQPSGQRAGGRERCVERPHHLPGTLFSKQLPSVRVHVPGRRTACIPFSPPAKFSISSIAENGDTEGWIHDGER